MRTIVVARLLQSQWFARLPGVCHSAVPCEDLLTRVRHLMAEHRENYTLQHIHNLFMLTRLAGYPTKDR